MKYFNVKKILFNKCSVLNPSLTSYHIYIVRKQGYYDYIMSYVNLKTCKLQQHKIANRILRNKSIYVKIWNTGVLS